MNKQNLQETKMQNLKTELDRVITFNKLMKREVGNRDHLFLQSQLLVKEGIKELSEAAYQQDRIKLRDALADTVVVAIGGAYICSGSSDDLSEPFQAIGESGIIYQAVTACVLYVESDQLSSEELGGMFHAVINCVECFAISEGIDLANDLKAVNDSNFSKFCKTANEALATIHKYKTEFGVDSEYRATGDDNYPFAVYVAETKGDFPKGKLLKSVDYQGPIFS